VKTVASYLIKVTVRDAEPTMDPSSGQLKPGDLVVPLTIEEIENLLADALGNVMMTKVGVRAERTDI